MRKILFIFLFLASRVSAQIPLAGYITTMGASDTYATHIDSLGTGGYMTTYNITTRNAIPSARRKAGMMVRYSSADSTFVLSGGITNTHWVQFSSGSGSSLRYQIDMTNDAENGWTIPFTLSSNAVIIYANTPLQATEWSGEGSTTLTVTVTTKKYDKITILN